jgi:hypothetical protein
MRFEAFKAMMIHIVLLWTLIPYSPTGLEGSHIPDCTVSCSEGGNIMTCISIDRQRVGKHIPTTHEKATIEGHPLLGNGSVNTPP